MACGDEAVQIREQLENEHAFEDLTIINFDDIAHLVSAAAKNFSVEVEKIDAAEPDIPPVAFCSYRVAVVMEESLDSQPC